MIHFPSNATFSPLDGDALVEHLGRPEGQALGLLDHLLVHRHRGVVENDGGVALVDLGVHSRVLDQVGDPLLAVLLGQVKGLGQLGNVHSLVHSAVDLGHEFSCRLEEGICGVSEEEVLLEHLLAVSELVLGILKRVVNVQRLDEPCEGVLVLVLLLSDDSDEVLESLLEDGSGVRVATGNHGDNQVSQNPGAGSLDGGDVGGREEEVAQSVLALGVVLEEGEQRPVDDPHSLMQLALGVQRSRVDRVPQLSKLLEHGIPLGGQNLAGESAPGSRGHELRVGGQGSEVVQNVGSSLVSAGVVLELAKLVQQVDLLDRKTVLGGQQSLVLSLVLLELRHHLGVLQHLKHGLGGLLQLGQRLDHVLLLGLQICVLLAQLLAQLHQIVGHVGILEQIVLQLEQLCVVVNTPALEKLQQGVDEMSVQKGQRFLGQIVLHGCLVMCDVHEGLNIFRRMKVG